MHKAIMSEHAPKFPGHEDVTHKLRQLVGGAIGRDEIARWAAQWVTRLDEAENPDRKLFNAIERLSAADMISTDRPYLYDMSDFERWLAELTEDQ